MKERNKLILYKPEQDRIDSFPSYTKYQRRDIFVLTKRLSLAIKNFKLNNRPYFFVMYAYFKTHNKFYSKHSLKDLQRAAVVLAIKSPVTSVDIQTRKKYENEILKIFEFKNLSVKNEDIFIYFVHSMIRKRKTNKDIFDFLIEEFAKRKVTVPDYKTIESLIYKAFDLFNPYEQVGNIKFNKMQKAIFTEILESKIDESLKNKPNLIYKSSKLKQIEQSQKLRDVRQAINLYKDLKRYYLNFQDYVHLLNLDDEGIKKAATEFRKMDLSKVKRLSPEKRNVLILSFIKDQHFKYTDHFVEIVIDSVQKLQRKARLQYKEQVNKNHSDKNKTFIELVETASADNQLLMEVVKLCQNKIISSDEKIDGILKILKGKIKGRQSKVERYKAVRDNLKSEENLYPNLLLDNLTSTKNKIKNILNVLEFEADIDTKGSSILKVLSLITKKDYIDLTQNDHLSENDKKRIEFSSDSEKLFLAYLYIAIANNIKSGALNLKHSYKYRSLEQYLISKENWKNNKNDLLKKAGLESFSDFNKTITRYKKLLDTQYVTTNQNIKKGNNEHFKNKGNGKFVISTPATDYSTENLLFPYFPKNDFVPLAEVLTTIHQKTKFLDSFAHLKRSYLKKRPEIESFIAGMIALGCNIGERKMGKISKSINTNTLSSTITWYFSKESLSKNHFISIFTFIYINYGRRRPSLL